MSQGLTGLFLGAGASYDLQMPLVWELTAELKDWLTPEKLREFNAGWAAQGEGHPHEVIEDFLSVWERADLHYESVLGYLEAQARRQGQNSQSYYGFYSWLIQMIYYKLYGDHVQRKDTILGMLKLYSGVYDLYLKNRPLWIFSLNHDSMVEAIAKQYAIPLYSGFSKNITQLPRRNAAGEIIGTVEAETLSKATLDDGAMFFPNPAKEGIYLLKLHGALDIFTYNDGEDLLKFRPMEETPEAVFDLLRIVNDELFFPAPTEVGGKVHVLNEIAYADADGEMQFLRRTLLSGAQKFHERGVQVLPKSMLKHFRSNLNFVQKLVCLGYGFGDSHINDSIRDWLSFSGARKIEIVSPNISCIPACILHLAPQVSIVRSGATEYLDLLAGERRSGIDTSEKEALALSRSMGRAKGMKLTEEFRQLESKRFASRVHEMVARYLNDHGDLNGVETTDLLRKFIPECADTYEATLHRLIDFLKQKKNEGI